jgi:release factor glutamine methyltransferase
MSVTPQPAPVRAATAGSWRAAWRGAAARLAVPLEARWLVEEVAGFAGAELWRRLDEPAPEAACARLDELVAARAAGVPLGYVLGRVPFCGVELSVRPGVLIPRPETELVVARALAELGRAGVVWPTVVELGTGSGAIALGLAAGAVGAGLAGISVLAVERSCAALAVAAENLARHPRLARSIRLVPGSWFAPLPASLAGRVDLVVANPPYVAASEAPALPAEVADHEPHEALFSARDGLEASADILAGAGQVLSPSGLVVLEVAATRASQTARLATTLGWRRVCVHPDLAGRPRVLVCRGARVPARARPTRSQ